MQGSKRILNIGAGNMEYGTDRIDILPSKYTTLVCDVEKGLPYESEIFDEIFTQNLFEHLRNPGFFLEECYRVLKIGGKLTLITDYAGCSRYYWGVTGTHEGRYEEKHDSRDKHYSIFTRSHLRNHFENVGFKINCLNLVGTDTLGKWIDLFTRQKPRIMVEAFK
jgi:predicted SAM-dependent methyltransferase